MLDPWKYSKGLQFFPLKNTLSCFHPLVVGDNARDTTKLFGLDIFSYKAYACVVGMKSYMQGEQVIGGGLSQDPLVVLQIHGVRWLSMGQVTKQMGLCNHDFVSSSPIGHAYTNFGSES